MNKRKAGYVKQVKGKKDIQIFLLFAFLIFVAAVLVNAAPQYMIVTSFKMGLYKFFMGVGIVSVPMLLLYALTGWVKLAILLPTGILLFLGTANTYIYSFRSVMLEPADFLSIRTAMNVAGSYSLLPVPKEIIHVWVIFVLFLVLMCFIPYNWKSRPFVYGRMGAALLSVVLCIMAYGYIIEAKSHHWHKEGATYQGYYLDFAVKFKEIKAKKPKNYQLDEMKELASRYDVTDEMDNSGYTENGDAGKKPPHLIVIMDEAFSNLNIIGELMEQGGLKTNEPVTPFIDSLKEECVSGYALSSVFAGNTPNSEFEFLTGNSMAWLPPYTVPYQQYLKGSSYSIVSYLKSFYDYDCIAMHPYHSSGWNRTKTYPNFGFDEWMFLEDFLQEKMVRNFVSDEEMFDQVIQVYEEERDNPLFLFGVTMQNHGNYLYAGYEPSITLTEYAGVYPDADQYLSLIHETDKAVKGLIEYFESVEDEVVIVFFGDHLPHMGNDFYPNMNGSELDTLDEFQRKYMVPFFVWTNGEQTAQHVECTSLNYLSNYMYEAAGIPLPSYGKFLEELEEVIPAVNANGYYSKENGGFLAFEEAQGEEAQWLQLYEKLQYHNLFDVKNRDEGMFPVLK